MTRVYAVVAELLLLSALSCVVSQAALATDDTEMIVGGRPVDEGKYPWQVRIYSTMDDKVGFCGGSIIAPQWVLTAAHCLLDTQKVVVGYGSNDRTETTKIESEKIIVHPDYLKGDKADLGLIKLKQPIPDAPTIAVADADVDKSIDVPGAKVTVTGWGAIWDFQAFQNAVDVMAGRRSLSERKLLEQQELNAPRKLHEVDIEVIDSGECKSVYKALDVPAFTVGDTEICATGPSGGKDSCFGDSGGPLVAPASAVARGYVQLGIVSWGPQCGNPLYPGVYTRVSSFTDWIDSTMKSQ
ncbi:serine protease [Methyloceanibacter sp.]|uniref:serine protease n=1 Tax=Methyloceanibacter sp. TaxID=1965321 RepID=UPI002D450F21|nr:serine protease [Methyloceanibacter sp.]HZP09182.1 serine protease [Methyloceanibacter sp.]